MKQLEAKRSTVVDGREVVFWVHQAAPLQTVDGVSPAHWILIADSGRGWSLLERLGQGDEPIRQLEEYSEDELRVLWLRRGL